MTTFSDEDVNNEQLVHGAVENALNEFTGDLSFPENFPTDAPHQQPQTQEQQHLQEHYQQQGYVPVQEGQQQLFIAQGDVHMKTKVVKKTKKQKSSHNTGRWTEAEHYAFLQGVEQHGKNCNKIAAMIPSRTILQVRTHAQKYFEKLEKGGATNNARLLENNTAPVPVLQRETLTSPIAAQTLLGMSQLTQPHQHQQQGTKRKLNLGAKSSKKANVCKYRDCKAFIYKSTQACLKHQIMLCTFPGCEEFVEEDYRFKQKRELCRDHYALLTQRSRSMYPTRADRP